MDFTTLQKTIEYPPPRILLYGPPGIGKTTFASQAPSPVFMDIENGLGGIASAKVRIQTWPEVMQMINGLITQNHNFLTLNIDSGDFLEKIIWKEVAVSNRVSSIDDIGYNRGYGYALEYWKALTTKLNELREKKGMVIIIICHDHVIRFDDPMGPGYDTYQINIQKRAAPGLIAWADGVFFMKEKTIIQSEKGGFTGEIRKAKSGGVYIHAAETPAYIAKNREFLGLPDEFPVSKNNGWNDFIAQIGKGNFQQQTQGTQNV